jgi:cytochrome c-type biogenesis protein CcmH
MLSAELTLGLMALITLLAVVALSRPWWRRTSGDEAGRRALNVATYRQRIDEIEQEHAGGILDDETASQLKAEQGARLLADTGAEDRDARAGSSRLWVLLALVPVLATAFYWQQGRWEVATTAEQARLDPRAGEQLALKRALAASEAAQQADPEDAQGWATLGQLRMADGQAEGAAEAFARANALLPDQPDWWVAEAEALAATQGQDLRGAPSERIEKALALAPDHGKGLFYGGMAAAQRDDIEVARERWTRLLQQHELPPRLREVIEQGVERWGGGLPAGGGALTVTVQLPDPPPGDLPERPVLWVFAKAVDGPPMPLAVKRMPSPTFPVTVTLSDDDAMMPSVRLSQFAHVEITARLGSGADVQARPGDLEGRVASVTPGDDAPLTVVLETRVGADAAP